MSKLQKLNISVLLLLFYLFLEVYRFVPLIILKLNLNTLFTLAKTPGYFKKFPFTSGAHPFKPNFLSRDPFSNSSDFHPIFPTQYPIL